MYQRKTKRFHFALSVSAAGSLLFLLLLAILGRSLAAGSYRGLTDALFVVMSLATASFVAFSFFPYFRGDKRWYSISALLTAAFFIGAVIVWQAPIAGGV